MSQPRARPGSKAAATRGRILDAAASVFRSNGYTNTRLVDVAAAAKIRTSSLYYHFGSREELVEEVLRIGHERASGYVRRRVAALPADATALDQLEAAVSAHLAAILEVGDYTTATIRILGQVPEVIRRRRLHEQREYAQYWRGLFERTAAGGHLRADLDPSVTRMFLLGAMNSAPGVRPRHRGVAAAPLERQVRAVFFDGLASPPPVPPDDRFEVEIAAVVAGRDALAGLPLVTGAAAGTERILDAAAEVFRDLGYAQTRLADVASAVGMKTASLYNHFDSREDLVIHLLLAAWTRTRDLVRLSVTALPDGASAGQRFAVAIAAHLCSLLSDNSYATALVQVIGQVSDAVYERTIYHQRTYFTYLGKLLDDAIGAREIRADIETADVITMLVGASNWAVQWHRDNGRFTPSRLMRHYLALVFSGLVKA